MAGIKIVGFLGIAPKISPELLPNTAGQVATNCKFYSGDLIPYSQPVIIANTGRTGAIGTLFALRDPVTGAKKWLSWLTDVDIAIASKTDKAEQRFYYTGDGSPKVSNYVLATAGAGPYPATSYDLGLSPPDNSAQLVATAIPFTEKTTVSYTRDAASVVTIVTSAPHNLRANSPVTVSGFGYSLGDYKQNPSTRTGTYNQPLGTLSMLISVANHGLQAGMVANLQFSAHASIDGAYSVNIVDDNTFAITAPTAAARAGTITWTNSGDTTIHITMTAHGLVNGTQVTLEFTSGTAVDGNYTLSNATTDAFDIVATVPAATSGIVRRDNRSLNATNVEITIVDDTTFTYFSPGPQISTTLSSEGKINLGGLTQARSYTFTWITPWDEESIAAKPSENLFIKEGVVVTVSNIPVAKPAGNNFVRGVKLYRTLAAASGTEYYFLDTLWFPTGLAKVQRTANVSHVTLLYPHNLSIEDRFKISGCTESSFDITDGIVTDVIDDYIFEYSQTSYNLSEILVGAGILYHDISENPPISVARYWGDGGVYTFTDDFESRDLFDILGTDEYDPPPTELKGLTVIQNNVLCGFVGNTLYFSEPARPHAWPAAYAINLDYSIVGIAVISGSALVTTEAYPYLVSGSDPANGMATARINANYPCLSKNSMVTMGYGVVYSTHEGLAVYSPSSGQAIITALLYNNSTWKADVDPKTVIAEYYGGDYIASHSAGMFVFTHDPKIGGFFTDVDYSFSASWYDAIDGIVYYVSGATGDIYEWDNSAQPATTLKWKSKVISTKDMINLGAARVVADYAADTIIFRLWTDKQLLLETPVATSGMFRLPTGYRSDTFEVEVEGNARVRAIYLAETPLGLKEV